MRYTVDEARTKFGEEVIKMLLSADAEQTGRCLHEPKYKFDEWRSCEELPVGRTYLRAYYNLPWNMDIFAGIAWEQFAEIEVI